MLPAATGAQEPANSFRFTGRLAGAALRAGSYRLVGTPTEAAGKGEVQER